MCEFCAKVHTARVPVEVGVKRSYTRDASSWGLPSKKVIPASSTGTALVPAVHPAGMSVATCRTDTVAGHWTGSAADIMADNQRKVSSGRYIRIQYRARTVQKCNA